MSDHGPTCNCEACTASTVAPALTREQRQALDASWREGVIALNWSGVLAFVILGVGAWAWHAVGFVFALVLWFVLVLLWNRMFRRFF